MFAASVTSQLWLGLTELGWAGLSMVGLGWAGNGLVWSGPVRSGLDWNRLDCTYWTELDGTT
jgi:hypothetical protein